MGEMAWTRVYVRAAACVTVAAAREAARSRAWLSARLQFDEQLVNIKRRVAVNIRLGRYPVVARSCLASYTPRLAELQVVFKFINGVDDSEFSRAESKPL